jgi:hypothetical protein
MDVDIPPLRDSPREPALMRIQMEVPSSLEKPRQVGLPQIRDGRFLLTRAKPTEIMGLRFAAARFVRSCAQISFYDRQNSHFMTDEFHFMPDKFHLMPDPTFFVGSGIK